MSNKTLYVDLSDKLDVCINSQNPCINSQNRTPCYFFQKDSEMEKRINDIFTYSLLVEALAKNSLQISHKINFDLSSVDDVWHSCRNNVESLANAHLRNHNVNYMAINPTVQKKLISTLLHMFEDQFGKKY